MQHRLTLRVTVAFLLFFVTAVWAAEKRITPTISARTSSDTRSPVFAKGEVLSYLAKLNDLPAGDGEIRIRKEQQESREVYRVSAQGRTNELVDFLFRLRGEADGIFSVSGFTPISFRLAYTEWDRPRELGVRYDPENKILVGVTKKKEQAKEHREPAADVYDPFSAFYLLRSRDLALGSSHQVDVFTGKDRYQVIAYVVRKETIDLRESERSALRLHLEGFRATDGSRKNVFPEETTLWVSSDEAHVPLKFESLLPVGVLVMELSGR